MLSFFSFILLNPSRRAGTGNIGLAFRCDRPITPACVAPRRRRVGFVGRASPVKPLALNSKGAHKWSRCSVLHRFTSTHRHFPISKKRSLLDIFPISPVHAPIPAGLNFRMVDLSPFANIRRVLKNPVKSIVVL